jgi:hypothetical protein
MNQQAPAPPIYWLIWATITAAFFLAVGIFETAATPAGTLSWLALMALPPFIASAVIRFGLLPQCHGARPKKFIFLLGRALAQSGGLFALILSSPWKTPLAAAALVLIIAYIPSFIIQRP